MPLSCLMLLVSYQCFLVAEAGSQSFGISQVASSIVADINDKPVAEGEVLLDFIQSAVADWA